MHHMIFIPGVTATDATALLEAGLPDHVAGAEMRASDGPDGARGMLYFWRRPGEGGLYFGYQPDAQDWVAATPIGDVVPRGRYWVGIDRERPPRPDEIRRPYPYKGTSRELGDGHEWRIPQPAELPANMVLADDGSWTFEVQRQFADFAADAAAWWEKVDPAAEFLFSDLADFIVRALRINYRITPELVSMLRLITTENVRKVFLASIGMTEEGTPNV